MERIKKTQNELLNKKGAFKEGKRKKKSNRQFEKNRKNKLPEDKNSQLALTQLKQNEAQLAKKLTEDNKKRQEIARAVKKAIESEIRKVKKPNESKFSLTPEGIAMSKNFNNNKGRLSYSVERGEITSSYGKHRHHLVSTATVDNNGVDITTTKNASVRAVFNGKVTSVLIIPGAGKVVMISHGEYRTVYANLQEVFVNKGDQVKKYKQNIGKLLIKDAEFLKLILKYGE